MWWVGKKQNSYYLTPILVFDNFSKNIYGHRAVLEKNELNKSKSLALTSDPTPVKVLLGKE